MIETNRVKFYVWLLEKGGVTGERVVLGLYDAGSARINFTAVTFRGVIR
jgi:hypothetical protein